MQRVPDVERFLRDLERPVPGISGGEPRGGLTAVSEADLEDDAQAFMAFASAFGVTPPRANANRDEAVNVTSASST